MACQFYNNNGYSCGGCVNFVKSTAITITNNMLVIQIPTQTFINHQKMCLCLIQSIPVNITANMPVMVQIGTTATYYPVRTKCGNVLYADQVRSRKVYPLFSATDTSSFVLLDLCKVCKTAHTFPTIPVTPTTSVVSKEA